MTEGGGPSSSRVRAAAISSGPRVRRPAAQSHGGGGVQFYWKKEEGDVGVPARLDQKVQGREERRRRNGMLNNKPTSKRSTLKDLCPEDKTRVRQLVQGLARVGTEKEVMAEQLAEERRKFQEFLAQLKTEHETVVEEKKLLKKELQNSLYQLQQMNIRPHHSPSSLPPSSHYPPHHPSSHPPPPPHPPHSHNTTTHTHTHTHPPPHPYPHPSSSAPPPPSQSSPSPSPSPSSFPFPSSRTNIDRCRPNVTACPDDTIDWVSLPPATPIDERRVSDRTTMSVSTSKKRGSPLKEGNTRTRTHRHACTAEESSLTSTNARSRLKQQSAPNSDSDSQLQKISSSECSKSKMCLHRSSEDVSTQTVFLHSSATQTSPSVLMSKASSSDTQAHTLTHAHSARNMPTEGESQTSFADKSNNVQPPSIVVTTHNPPPLPPSPPPPHLPSTTTTHRVVGATQTHASTSTPVPPCNGGRATGEAGSLLQQMARDSKDRRLLCGECEVRATQLQGGGHLSSTQQQQKHCPGEPESIPSCLQSRGGGGGGGGRERKKEENQLDISSSSSDDPVVVVDPEARIDVMMATALLNAQDTLHSLHSLHSMRSMEHSRRRMESCCLVVGPGGDSHSDTKSDSHSRSSQSHVLQTAAVAASGSSVVVPPKGTHGHRHSNTTAAATDAASTHGHTRAHTHMYVPRSVEKEEADCGSLSDILGTWTAAASPTMDTLATSTASPERQQQWRLFDPPHVQDRNPIRAPSVSVSSSRPYGSGSARQPRKPLVRNSYNTSKQKDTASPRTRTSTRTHTCTHTHPDDSAESYYHTSSTRQGQRQRKQDHPCPGPRLNHLEREFEFGRSGASASEAEVSLYCLPSCHSHSSSSNSSLDTMPHVQEESSIEEQVLEDLFFIQ